MKTQKNDKQMKEKANSTQSVAEKSNRGGARAGAGRKALDPALKKVTLAIRITPASKERYNQLQRLGIDVNERIESAIEKLAKAFGVE